MGIMNQQSIEQGNARYEDAAETFGMGYERQAEMIESSDAELITIDRAWTNDRPFGEFVAVRREMARRGLPLSDGPERQAGMIDDMVIPGATIRQMITIKGSADRAGIAVASLERMAAARYGVEIHRIDMAQASDLIGRLGRGRAAVMGGSR